jgi:hypothetical protein
MHIDFSGAELFLDLLAGRATAHDVLQHPAYQAVAHHARLYSIGISEQVLERALQGQDSPFYGLDGVADHLAGIQTLLETIRMEHDSWVRIAQGTLSRLLPEADLNIAIYPIIGYDMGIGLNGAVCMNCNHSPYLSEPREFLFFVIHECMHVIYERCHRVPPLADVNSPADWRAYFNLWVQNEGFAVYAPLYLRLEMGCLRERDYAVVFDRGELETLRLSFLKVLDALEQDDPLSRDEYLEACFGPTRLTYRIGCELVGRIESTGGLEAVRRAFYLDADRFMREYRNLLER